MTDAPDQPLPLAAEFPAATREDWLRLVQSALKGAPFERLIHTAHDDLAAEPVYTRRVDAIPVARQATGAPWQVVQRVDHPDPAAANAEALHDLENGATGLSLVFAGAIGSYGYGLPPDAEAVARVLDGVELDGVTIDLDISEPSKDAAAHLAALVRRREMAPGGLAIRFGHDPIGASAQMGVSPLPWPDLAPRFAAHVAELAELGFQGPLTVADGRIIHNAGGSEAQELAYVIATGVAYLRALEGAGVALDAARRMIAFRLSADAHQFLTIAKFRALRKLWARVEDACGLAPIPAFVAAETAWRMMSRRDPHMNMLRTAIAVYAAGVGGADAITVLPFTAAIGLPNRFARRVARNSQLILLEESNLARVADPAAGSGAVEALTDQLGRTAWSLLQQIEAAGGAGAALEAGLIQRQVAEVRAKREAAIATRKDGLIGTSEYPNLAEAPAQVLDVAPLAEASPAANVAGAKPLPRIRLAEPFERLRDASDRMLAEGGARPKIFLANLGKPAEFTPRSHFAWNFFEAGGIQAVSNDGFERRETLIAAFKASGATLACLCATDEANERDGVEAAKALRAEGARVYLAGRPKQPDSFKAAGVEAFIFTGCDALAVLQKAHAFIGG